MLDSRAAVGRPYNQRVRCFFPNFDNCFRSVSFSDGREHIDQTATLQFRHLVIQVTYGFPSQLALEFIQLGMIVLESEDDLF